MVAAAAAVAMLPGCVLGGGLPDVATPLTAAVVDSVACDEAVGRRGGGGAEDPHAHVQEEARYLTQATTIAVAVVVVVVVIAEEVVVVVGTGFRAAHDARGGLGCAARKGFAAGRIGLGVIRHRGVTAMAGVGDGKRGEGVLQTPAGLGSC